MTFKVGDKVFCLRSGNGVVTTDDMSGDYPIIVRFETCGSHIKYTSEGYSYKEDKVPMLYHGKPEIIAPPEPYRLPDIALDTPVLVRMSVLEEWEKRHFSNWTDNGQIKTFPDGKTSWSWSASDRNTITWEEWKLP